MKPIVDREQLGRLVRETWVAWAREQPNPKVSWTDPWEMLDERMREVDRRIGEAVANAVFKAVLGQRVAGDQERRIEVQAGYGANTQRPFVSLTVPDGLAQLAPQEALEVGLNLIQACEWALTDGLMIDFFVRQMGFEMEQIAPLFMQLRNYRARHSREGT